MEKILEKINKAALIFLSANSPEDTYVEVVNQAIKLVKADDASIFLKKGDETVIAYSSLNYASLIVPRKKGYLSECIAKRKSFIIHSEEFSTHHPEISDHGVKSTIFIPLFYKRSTIGALVVLSFQTKTLTDRELDILKIYGSMASLAINNIQLLEETKNALQTRDLFISMASHEFKTPLTAINGYSQLLEKKFLNSLGKELEWIQNLKKEGQRLTRLVKELLEINQIKTGQFQFDFTECNLREIIIQTVSAFKVSYHKRELVISDDTQNKPLTIIGDPIKLVQMITNILNNAAKFSPINSAINLSISTSANSIILKVKDSGIGIKKEDLPKIFESFYKGSHNLKEGMGLGLYLSKIVVEKHRGKISIDSKVDKGTTVKIKLPIAKI